MSNTKITLNQQEYNAVHGLVSSIKGTYSKVAGSKVASLIEEAVKAGVQDEKLPSQIVLDIDTRLLDGVYLGLTEIALEEKVTASDIKVLTSVAKLVKSKSRFDAFLTKHLESLPAVDEPLDIEELDIPLDS